MAGRPHLSGGLPKQSAWAAHGSPGERSFESSCAKCQLDIDLEKRQRDLSAQGFHIGEAERPSHNVPSRPWFYLRI